MSDRTPESTPGSAGPDATRPEKTPVGDTAGAGTPTGDDVVDRTGERAGEPGATPTSERSEAADDTADDAVEGEGMDPSTKLSTDPAVAAATKGAGTPGADADATSADEDDVTAGNTTERRGGLEPAGTPAAATPVTTRRGMFGSPDGPGDTSGYAGLVSTSTVGAPSPRPFGGWFDEVADALSESLDEVGLGQGSAAGAIEKVVVAFGEVTFHVRREHIVEVCRRLRDEPDLRFELSLGVSGVHYPEDAGRELHAVYHLKSITHGRRVRLEVSVPDADPHIPSTTAVYPTHDWHERETWDFFGLQFDGHPALTRIHMPDDWPGHPQRKDYPLGGIPVEYKGATVPSPDVRRQYS